MNFKKNNKLIGIGFYFYFLTAILSFCSSLAIIIIVLLNKFGIDATKTSVILMAIFLSLLDFFIVFWILFYSIKVLFLNYKKTDIIKCICIVFFFIFWWLLNIIIFNNNVLNLVLSAINISLYLIGSLLINLNIINNNH